ncbi:hypothetical protein RQP46_003763 [Phenoliferia psychrophenolica]
MKQEVAPAWNALSILDERDGQYLVEWEGINSATGEQWEPSWEPIGNGNAALVAAWKESQPYKIKRETLEFRPTATSSFKCWAFGYLQLEAFKTRIKREPHLLEAVESIEATFALSEELPKGDSIGTEDFFNLVSYCPHLKRLNIIKLSERCFLSDKGFFPDLRRILAALAVFESTDSRMSRPGGLDHLIPYLRKVHTLSIDPLDFGTNIDYPKLPLLRQLTLSSRDYHQMVHDKTPLFKPGPNLLVLLTASALVSLRLSYGILYALYWLPGHPVTLPPRLNVIIDTHHHHHFLFQQNLPKTSLSQLHLHFVSEPGISNHSYSSTSPQDFFLGLPDSLTALSWTITEAAWIDGTYGTGLGNLVRMTSWERKPIPNLKRVTLFIQKKLATPGREATIAPMLEEWIEKLKGQGIMLETWYEESTLP